MSRLWTGPWVARQLAEPGTPVHWSPPDGVIESLDVRSIPECALQPGVDPAVGAGYFRTEDATDLGADYVEVPPAINDATRAALETSLGITGITATTPRELLIDLLTTHADPIGVTGCPPIMPDEHGQIRLRWGGMSFDHAVDPSSALWPKILTVLQAEYRQMREDAHRGARGRWDPITQSFVADADFHRRYLSVLLEQFRLRDHTLFIPADLPHEDPLPHHTSIAETFNTSDGSTLGPLLSWSEFQNNTSFDCFDITSNECVCNKAGSFNSTARADSDLSSSNHTAQITATDLSTGSDNQQAGPCCRMSGSAETMYWTRILQISDALQTGKTVAGALTDLSSGGTAVTVSVPTTLKLRVSGSTLQQFQDGVQKGADITDTAIAGNTRAGLIAYCGFIFHCHMDNFSAADLAAAAAVLRRGTPILQAVNRAATY